MTTLNKYDLQWCVKRLPRTLRSILKKEEIVVAGGYIRSCILNEKINDIDLFIPYPDYAKEIALSLSDNNEKKLFITDNAITVKGLKHPVQFITRWVFDDPKKVLGSFDFTVCEAAFWWDHYSLRWCSACSESYYQDLAAKRLIYTNPVREEEPGGSMLRVLKYYQKGFRITMDSFSDVIARLAAGVHSAGDMIDDEGEIDVLQFKKIVKGLLHDVDPDIDPDHIIEG